MKGPRIACGMQVVLGLAAVVASVHPVRADDALDLVWTAPTECPDADAVRASVRQMVRSPELPKIAARVVVRSEPRGYRAEVTLARGDGTGRNVRRLEGGTCSEVTEAVALVLALTLDPTAAPAPRTEATAAAPAPAPVVTAPAPVAAALATASSAPTAAPTPATTATAAPSASAVGRAVSPHVAAGAGAFVDSSMLPSVAAGVRLAVEGAYGWGRVELRGALTFENEATLPNRDAGARYRFFALGILPGAQVFARGPVAFELLAGPQWVRALGSSFGVSQAAAGGASLVVLDAGAVARVAPFSGLVLRAEINGWVPLSRPSFVVEGLGPLHRMPVLSLQGGLSVAWVLF